MGFLMDLISSAVDASRKYGATVNKAKEDSEQYSDAELRRKFDNSHGAKKLGYGMAMKERREDS